MSGDAAIVFAPDWPGRRSGYEIALRSSLQFYINQYRKVTYFALTDREKPDDLGSIDGSVTFITVPILKRSIKVRFAKSLIARAPAVCSAFLERHVLSKLESELSNVINEQGVSDLIFEDVPIYSLLTETSILAGAGNRTILRSHNVLSEAFRGFTNESNPIKKYAWKHELAKILRFEETALKSADQTLAITRRDQSVYGEMFPETQVCLLPVGFDELFFESTLIDNATASSSKLLSLGSMDLRKAHGMVWFVNSCFKKISDGLHPEMELVLGGRGTADFNDPVNHIQGMGFVADEREFMKLGQTFINPQKYGSGVKLKSLVAMAYGKCLVSTPKGVEGIDAEPGKHFLLADTESQMNKLLLRIHSGEIDTFKIGMNARQFVLDNYRQSQIQICD